MMLTCVGLYEDARENYWMEVSSTFPCTTQLARNTSFVLSSLVARDSRTGLLDGLARPEVLVMECSFSSLSHLLHAPWHEQPRILEPPTIFTQGSRAHGGPCLREAPVQNFKGKVDRQKKKNPLLTVVVGILRSEERRVGKECLL